MSLPVELRDAATAEFDEAFDRYDALRAGLGPDFAEQLNPYVRGQFATLWDSVRASAGMGEE